MVRSSCWEPEMSSLFCTQIWAHVASTPPPPPPDVISPSGHVVVHPGQCLQMRQTERRSPVPAAVVLPDSRIHTGRIKHKEDASILD